MSGAPDASVEVALGYLFQDRSLVETALSFMGGIYSARRVKNLLAPALAERLVTDEVDVAILVPV